MRYLFFVLSCFFCFSLLAQETPSLKLSESQVDEKLKAHIQPSETGSNRVGKIVISDFSSGITQSTWIYVKNALDYYKKNPPLFIILELNTPGGEVFVAQKISDALKEMDTQYNVPIIAYINNWAVSAGAMLAYSSRYIAVVKDASMGAAEPVLQDTSGEMKSASEKVNSAIRTDFGNRAAFFDRNPLLAEAMVDKDMILVLRDGKIIKLDNENQIRGEPNPDVIISPKGKLLTLTSQQLIDYGVADIYLPPVKLELITAEEKEKGKWPAYKEQLFEYPFFKAIPNATIDAYQMDLKQLFLSLLANPIVTSVLFLGMMLGAYMEISTPGFGFAGTLAVVCLFLLILSSFALEIGDWLELILLLSGLAIIIGDLLILPTFGLLGTIGTVMFLVGLFGMLLPGVGSINFDFDTNTFNAAGEAFLSRLAWLTGTFLVGLFIMYILARFIKPRFPVFRKFVLEGHEQEGFLAGLNPKELPPIGTAGVVLSTLRPAGKVEINGKIYDAMSSGRFIEKGLKVVVMRIEGSNLIVREVT